MIIDASVWVASVLEEEARHEASLSFMHCFVRERRIAIIPLLAWAEIAGAIARRTGDADRGMKVAGIITAKIWVKGVSLEASLASESMRLAASLRLRGADAIYVALAAVRREPLITLDAEMLERASQVAETFTPEQWLGKG